jgi:hypothetical protein
VKGFKIYPGLASRSGHQPAKRVPTRAMTPSKSPSRRKSEAVEGSRIWRQVWAAVLNSGFVGPGRTGGPAITSPTADQEIARPVCQQLDQHNDANWVVLPDEVIRSLWLQRHLLSIWALDESRHRRLRVRYARKHRVTGL